MGYEEILDFKEIKNKYKVVIENLSLLNEEQIKLFKLKGEGILILNIFQFYNFFQDISMF